MKSFALGSLRVCLFLAVATPCAAQNTFAPVCTSPNYPVPTPTAARDIDTQCGLSGSGGREAQQNSAKNNFCASGPAEPVAIGGLQTLQAAVDADASIAFGDEATPGRKAGPATNRAPLRKLGEGKQAVLTGFVLIARQEGKESVNCGKTVSDEPAEHDIHISIVASATETNECTSVVAEMSPHHRPDSWTAANVNKLAAAKAMVRVTGQLFFDSSHLPCAGGARVRSNPARVALWEIHPIYSFDVCTAKCETKPTWTPLYQWLAQH
jgi:hypothetical protein